MVKKNNSKQFYYLMVLIVYTIVIVYSMLFGFDRPQLALKQEYRYWLILDRIPLWIPSRLSLHTIQLWTIFTLGNLLAFVPFGFLTSIVFKHKINSFFRFTFAFLLFIFCMEVIQMVTYLGVFDVSDIVVNTMGAAIGYCAYKQSKRRKTRKHKLMAIALTIVLLSIAMFLLAELYNTTVTPYIERVFQL